MRWQLARAWSADLLREHDRLRRLARVVRPYRVRVAVGVDRHADEVGEVAVAAEDVAVQAAVADVAAVHDLGADLAGRPVGPRVARLAEEDVPLVGGIADRRAWGADPDEIDLPDITGGDSREDSGLSGRVHALRRRPRHTAVGGLREIDPHVLPRELRRERGIDVAAVIHREDREEILDARSERARVREMALPRGAA